MSIQPSPTDVSDPTIKITLRLIHNNEIAMGPGKAELLEAIQRTGSIAAAGKSMNMSYRRAWMLVDTMNRCFAKPLVHSTKGGKNGGGAKLTDLGVKVLDNYKKMNNAANYSAQAYLSLFTDLMAEPVEMPTDLPEESES